MAEPIISNVTLDHTKISAISGQNIAHVSFKFNVPVMEYAVRVNGTDQTTGIFAGSGIKNVDTVKTMTCDQAKLQTCAQIREYASATQITDAVDSTEMYAEGSNRINIYGKSLDGTWSMYNQP
jgi:hypothetical protein